MSCYISNWPCCNLAALGLVVNWKVLSLPASSPRQIVATTKPQQDRQTLHVALGDWWGALVFFHLVFPHSFLPLRCKDDGLEAVGLSSGG